MPDFKDVPRPEGVEFVEPEVEMDAHAADLGMTFYSGKMFPAKYRGGIFSAQHGSWNRTRKDGYKVVSLHWQADGNIVERDFMTGFLSGDDGEDVIGRPVDVAEAPDGSIFVSDDYAGAIYRVTADGGGPAQPQVDGPRGPWRGHLRRWPHHEQVERRRLEYRSWRAATDVWRCVVDDCGEEGLPERWAGGRGEGRVAGWCHLG